MVVSISTLLLGIVFIVMGYRSVGPRKGPIVIALIGAMLLAVAQPSWAKAVNDGVVSLASSISKIGQE